MKWLLAPEQAPFCKCEAGILVKHRSVEVDGERVLKACVDPLERDVSAINRHLQGKQSGQGAMGVYACSPLLRAMAAVKDVHLVVVNTHELQDMCTVYLPGTSPSTSKSLSWAEEVVPKLLRQQASSAAGKTPMAVILWNGKQDESGHFDATYYHACA